jgi:hypothetical protein
MSHKPLPVNIEFTQFGRCVKFRESIPFESNKNGIDIVTMTVVKTITLFVGMSLLALVSVVHADTVDFTKIEWNEINGRTDSSLTAVTASTGVKLTSSGGKMTLQYG